MLNRFSCLSVTLVLFFTGATALAAMPDWLRDAARAPLPNYPQETNAIVLLEERLVAVSASGEVRSTYRKAFKILRPAGQEKGTLYVYFDSQTEITSLKAWSITAAGEQFEVKKGDAVTGGYSEELYADTRYLVLQIPATHVGSIIGYEYQQRERPFVLQAIWGFQDEIPVRRARFVLELPSSWTYAAVWRNLKAVQPQPAGDNRWSWELSDVEPVQSERDMPTWRAVAGQFAVSFSSKDSSAQNGGSWAQIGRWYAETTNGRREVTPAIRDKAGEIVTGTSDPIEKIRRLASFVQHSIRYVAIEIGIGGYQPHAAQEVFASSYGDCKDKATLLSAMLHEVGIDSYYVLVNSQREYLAQDFPSMLAFNHVILAIRLADKASTDGLMPLLNHEKMGELLLFDPTDSSTPLGYLPPSLQASLGLLVTDSGGELVSIPLLPPTANRILRTAKLTVDAGGTLKGSVEEVRSGPFATELRERLLNLPEKQRQTVLQGILTELIDGAVLTGARLSSLRDSGPSMNVSYDVTVPAYAQHTGNLLLFRPCMLGRKGSTVLEGKARKQPIVFANATSESDTLEISLPAEYHIDELPKNVSSEYPFASYKSEITASGQQVQYGRTFELKEIRIPLDKMDDLKKFYTAIDADERSYVILRAP